MIVITPFRHEVQWVAQNCTTFKYFIAFKTGHKILHFALRRYSYILLTQGKKNEGKNLQKNIDQLRKVVWTFKIIPYWQEQSFY